MKKISFENGDIQLNKFGQLMIVEDFEAEKQLVREFIQTLYGECDLNTNIGVKWFDIMGKKLDQELIMNSIRENLSTLDFIDKVTFSDLSLEDREFRFRCTVVNKRGIEYVVNN